MPSSGPDLTELCADCGHWYGHHSSRIHESSGMHGLCTRPLCDCKHFVIAQEEECECGHNQGQHIGYSNWCVEQDKNDDDLVCPCMKYRPTQKQPTISNLITTCRCAHVVEKHASSNGLITWCDLCGCAQFVSAALATQKEVSANGN